VPPQEGGVPLDDGASGIPAIVPGLDDDEEDLGITRRA